MSDLPLCVFEVLLPLIPYTTASLVCRNWYDALWAVAPPTVNLLPVQVERRIFPRPIYPRNPAQWIEETNAYFSIVPRDLLMRARHIQMYTFWPCLADSISEQLGPLFAFGNCREIILLSPHVVLSKSLFPCVHKVSGVIGFDNLKSWQQWHFKSMDVSELRVKAACCDLFPQFVCTCREEELWDGVSVDFGSTVQVAHFLRVVRTRRRAHAMLWGRAYNDSDIELLLNTVFQTVETSLHFISRWQLKSSTKLVFSLSTQHPGKIAVKIHGTLSPEHTQNLLGDFSFSNKLVIL